MRKPLMRYTQLIAFVLVALLATQCINPMQDGLGMSPPPSGVSSGSTSPLALPDAMQGIAMMVYPESLESLLSESALIVIGEVGAVHRFLPHVIYGDDGSLLMEGDEKERAYAERVGLPATDLLFTVHEVFRNDGTTAQGDQIILRIAGTVSSEPPSVDAFSNVPAPEGGKFLYFLTPEPDGSAYAQAFGPWGKYTVDGETLRFASTGEVFQVGDSGPITLSQLLKTAASEEAQFVPPVRRPDPSVTPPWLLETDPIELFKQQIVSQYMLSGNSDEERAWREEWVNSGGEQILRESYELTVLLQQAEPNFLFGATQTSYDDNVPYRKKVHIRNMSAEEFTEKYLKDIPWADLVEVVVVTE